MPYVCVRYDDLVTGPETQARRMFEHLGVAHEPRAVRYDGHEHITKSFGDPMSVEKHDKPVTEPAEGHGAHACDATVHTVKRLRAPWAKLLARVFAVDVLACPRCTTGRMQRIAFITMSSAIRAILASVGLSTAPPSRSPARDSVQADFVWT